MLEQQLSMTPGNSLTNRLESLVAGISGRDLDRELQQRRELPSLSGMMRNGNGVAGQHSTHALLEQIRQQQDLQTLREVASATASRNNMDLSSSPSRPYLDQLQQAQNNLPPGLKDAINANGGMPSNPASSHDRIILDRIQNWQDTSSRPAINLPSEGAKPAAIIAPQSLPPLSQGQGAIDQMRQLEGTFPPSAGQAHDEMAMARDMKPPGLPRHRAIIDKILQEESKTNSAAEDIVVKPSVGHIEPPAIPRHSATVQEEVKSIMSTSSDPPTDQKEGLEQTAVNDDVKKAVVKTETQVTTDL